MYNPLVRPALPKMGVYGSRSLSFSTTPLFTLLTLRLLTLSPNLNFRLPLSVTFFVCVLVWSQSHKKQMVTFSWAATVASFLSKVWFIDCSFCSGCAWLAHRRRFSLRFDIMLSASFVWLSRNNSVMTEVKRNRENWYGSVVATLSFDGSTEFEEDKWFVGEGGGCTCPATNREVQSDSIWTHREICKFAYHVVSLNFSSKIRGYLFCPVHECNIHVLFASVTSCTVWCRWMCFVRW